MRSPHTTPPNEPAVGRVARIRFGCLLCVLGLVLAVVLVPFQGIVWDGGFPNAEYRLTFVDEAGRPVPGVTLRVQTRAGGECHLYPIDEFRPDFAPTSDAEGRMVFHHAGESLEFGGREYRNLLGMRFGEVDGPQYVCAFSVAGSEVYRVRYNDLLPVGEQAGSPKVSRPWRDSEWPSREYAAQHEAWPAHRLRLFDGNANGELDREERTAAGHFERVLERREIHRQGRDIDFFVVERTLTITPP